MATKKMFSIRDSKGEIYNPPFPQLTHAEAERTLARLANEPDTQIGLYPEDFDLYYLGEFDDVSGKFSLQDAPQHIMKAVNVVKPKIAQITQ